MTLVVILKLTIAADREHEFEQVVAERARGHRGTPGFERMYLLKSDEEHQYRLVSWWDHLDDPEAWVRTATYALSEDPRHAGLIVGPVPHEVLTIAQQF